MSPGNIFFRLQSFKLKFSLAALASSSFMSLTIHAQGAAPNASREVSGCIIYANSPSPLAVTQRLELSSEWVNTKSTHQSIGSAKFKLKDKALEVRGEFTYIPSGEIKINNRRFEQGESEIVFTVNGLSGRSPINKHHHLDDYLEGVFYPSKTSRKLEFLYWSPATIEFIAKENPSFSLFVFCTPRYNEGKAERPDTIYLK
jgi:hypothetical protein